MSPLEDRRQELQTFYHRKPFRPFALEMTNGDEVLVTQPNLIAFHPIAGTSQSFLVLGRPDHHGSLADIARIHDLD